MLCAAGWSLLAVRADHWGWDQWSESTSLRLLMLWSLRIRGFGGVWMLPDDFCSCGSLNSLFLCVPALLCVCHPHSISTLTPSAGRHRIAQHSPIICGITLTLTLHLLLLTQIWPSFGPQWKWSRARGFTRVLSLRHMEQSVRVFGLILPKWNLSESSLCEEEFSMTANVLPRNITAGH